MKTKNKIIGLNFGLGTIISLIIAYFIYLYASERGYKLLAFIAKAYLFVYLAIFILIFGIILLIFIVFLIALLLLNKKIKFADYIFKKGKNKNIKKEKIIDAEYKIIE